MTGQKRFDFRSLNFDRVIGGEETQRLTQRAIGLRKRRGQNFGLAVGNLPTGTVLAFVGFGLSSAQFGQFVLPYPLDGQGMPGCWLVQDMSLASAHPCVVNGTNAASSLAIPNDVGFVGLQMFAQAWAVAPGVNQTGIVLSGGLRVRVGS